MSELKSLDNAMSKSQLYGGKRHNLKFISDEIAKRVTQLGTLEITIKNNL